MQLLRRKTDDKRENTKGDLYMKGFLAIGMLGIALLFIVVGLAEAEPTAPAEKQVAGTTNLNSLVNSISLNNYFVKNNSYWKVCREQEGMIRGQEEGYELEQYSYGRIADVYGGRDYHHNIYKKEDGSFEMKVDLTCRYNVSVQVSAFGYAKEEMTRPGGSVLFEMNIRETEGRYQLIGMRAISSAP